MRSALLAAIAAGALASFAASPARANGRFPASNRLVVAPSDANLVVVRATYGLLLSHDHGETWSWLCEDVLGVSSSAVDDPLIEITGNASFVIGPELANGLTVSPDTGCSWVSVPGPLAGQLVKDLAVRPGAPDDVVAVTSTYGPTAGPDGGPGYAQQLYESTDDGVTWAMKGAPIDPSAVVTTVDLAATDPHRVYVSVQRGEGATRAASLFVSTDDAADWIERPVPIDNTRETAIFIGAVDPVDADTVYVRTMGTPSRLLVTNDAGQTFREALSLSDNIVGFAVADDGSKIYAGSVENGLMVAPRDTLAFQKVSSVPVECLAVHGADLWACSEEQTGFIAGLSNDDGATFTPKLHLLVEPLLQCPADAAASACAGQPLQSLCGLLGGCGGADAGGGADGSTSSSGGSSGAGPSGTGSGKSCACSTPGAPGEEAAMAACAGAALVSVLLLRRRRGLRG